MCVTPWPSNIKESYSIVVLLRSRSSRQNILDGPCFFSFSQSSIKKKKKKNPAVSITTRAQGVSVQSHRASGEWARWRWFLDTVSPHFWVTNPCSFFFNGSHLHACCCSLGYLSNKHFFYLKICARFLASSSGALPCTLLWLFCFVRSELLSPLLWCLLDMILGVLWMCWVFELSFMENAGKWGFVWLSKWVLALTNNIVQSNAHLFTFFCVFLHFFFLFSHYYSLWILVFVR